MEAREPQHPPESAAVLYFAAKEKLWHLSAGIAAVWIGIFGLLVVRLVEYAMALL
jgi:hypothetical protein